MSGVRADHQLRAHDPRAVRGGGDVQRFRGRAFSGDLLHHPRVVRGVREGAAGGRDDGALAVREGGDPAGVVLDGGVGRPDRHDPRVSYDYSTRTSTWAGLATRSLSPTRV